MAVPELERQRIALPGLVVTLELNLGAGCHSLSTAQVDNNFRLSIILTKKSMDHLFYSMNSHAVAAIDERVASDISWSKWLVEVWLIAEIQLGDASLGNDAAIVCLYAESVP
jgi:hypothetical protein